jgi:hypothetical protein
VQYRVLQRDEKEKSWIEFAGRDGTALRVTKNGGLPLSNILGKKWSELSIGTEVTIDTFELPEK